MTKILKSANFDTDHSVVVEPVRLVLNGPGANSEGGAAQSAPEQATSALVTEAQEHVEAMLNQARLKVVTWQEEARQEGWQTGYAEAHQAVEAELAEALATLHSLAQSAVEARDQFLRDSRAEIGRLAVAIAEQIIGKELKINPSVVTDIVARAIETAGVEGTCRIRVNPLDYDVLSPHWEAVASFQQLGSTWDLVADKRIGRGGCLIEAGGGTIDAQLETQLAQVELAFEEVGE